ncbi:hypothetical protein JCM8208_003978 [Rhodotorula glutinis]
MLALTGRIIDHAEGRRFERLDRERVWRIWRRHDALKPRYSVLRSTGDDELRLSVPSWANFRLLPSVENLWIPERDVVSDEQWQAALPSVLADLDTARRVLKVGYARQIVQSLIGSGAVTDSSLVDKLQQPKHVRKASGTLFGEADFGEVGRVERHFAFVFSDGPDGFLDFGDTADGVNEADLGPAGDARPLRTPSVQFVRQQLDVLKRAGLPNHRSSIAKLEELGPVFECHGCDADGKSGSLSWSEMVHHACKFHNDIYAASDNNRPAHRSRDPPLDLDIPAELDLPLYRFPHGADDRRARRRRRLRRSRTTRRPLSRPHLSPSPLTVA